VRAGRRESRTKREVGGTKEGHLFRCQQSHPFHQRLGGPPLVLGGSILADQAVAGSSCASRISALGQFLFPKAIYEVSNLLS
jgi:hypothetical protein